MDGYRKHFGDTGADAWDDAANGDPACAVIPRPSAARIVSSLERAGIGVFECDLKTERLAWTRSVYDIFGVVPKADIHRGEIVELYDEESLEALERLRSRAIERASGFTLDARITRPDGAARWIQIVAQVECEGDAPVRLSGTKQDITRQKLERDLLQQSAEIDSLTGLANRAVFQSRFLDSARTALGFRPLGALVLFDVDGFKQINDRFGHVAGDACLAQFGQRIRQAFPDALMVARIGGDEFAVLLPSHRNLQRLGRRVEGAVALLKTPILWNGLLLEAGASHGIAMAENAISYDAEAMFVRADQALYAAKRARKRQPVR
ncbi:sensor domain-containing diguanylate cyclase [Blastomonas sp. AAP53]|uniref:sensor domain-containing diguanylate cyclase n=1 Tax=Blastomonas sp. AAP53 TaxID=1248760 RepID=UPI0002ED4AD0|nr:sensor domain-containing diguanylate cyclase [Blastomonas sp. AAP53]